MMFWIFLIAFILFSWYMVKLEKEEKLKEMEIFEQKFEQEKLKPLYVVMFKLYGQENKLKTIPLKPYKWYGSRSYNYIVSSKSHAQMAMEDSYKKGYFMCEKGYLYPAPNIDYSWVEEVSND